VLTRSLELSCGEPNGTQYVMSPCKHRRSRSLFGHGKDPLGQFSRLSEITAVAAQVRQGKENLHQLGILA
jgi:hypothetical protein